MDFDRILRAPSLILVVAAAVGCSPSPGSDAGDASAAETGGEHDSGQHETDSGATADASDGGTAGDSGDAADAGGGSDGGGVLHNCTTFVDRSGAASAREVHFHSPSYSPRCMTISAGQSVTFIGPMAEHPLNPGVAPSRAGDPPGTSPNPIPMTTTGSSAMVTFPTAGTYPFYCSVHESTNMMYGVIQVR